MAQKYLNIKLYRETRGYTQSDIGEKLNISSTAYRNKETGMTEFTATELLILADLYKVTTEDLLRGKEIKL